MIFDASKTQKWTSWTSFNHFRVLKTDIDVRYVILGAFWRSWRLIWAVFGAQGAVLGVHLGAPEASWRVTRAPRRRHFFIKIDAHFAYPILNIIWVLLGHFGATFWLSKGLPDAPKWSRSCIFPRLCFVYLRLLFLMFAYLCVLILILVLALVLILAFAY